MDLMNYSPSAPDVNALLTLLKNIVKVLNNPSLAAFVGAFSAFFLVWLTDWRRRHQKKRLISRRIQINRDIAESKLETAETSIDDFKQNRAFPAGPVMKFPVEDLRLLQRETLTILTSTQILAIDALIYWMEAIDATFAEAHQKIKELSKMEKEGKTFNVKMKKGNEIVSVFKDAIINIESFLKLSQFYIDSEPEKILTFRHP